MTTLTSTVYNDNNNMQPPHSSFVQGCQSSTDIKTGEKSMTLDIAVRMLMKQVSDMKSMLDTFRNDFNRKIDSIQSELQEKVGVLQSEIKILKAKYEGKFLNQDISMDQVSHRIDHLNLNISALENQKTLIISGVPFARDEYPDELFAMICRQLECSGVDKQLASTRRIHVNGLKDGDVSPLLAEFALKTTRDRFYSTYLRKRDLNTGLGTFFIRSTSR